MEAIEILYIIFLVGSLAFGLEAIFVGLGGKLMIVYHRRKLSTLTAALLTGLGIVSLAVATSMVLGLEPIFFALLVLIYSFVAGQLIRAFGSRRVTITPLPELPKSSEREMEDVVIKRGYRNLVEKRREVQRGSLQRGNKVKGRKR